jgi:HEAT repeat protein
VRQLNARRGKDFKERERRRRALNRLGALGDARVVPLLVKAMVDPGLTHEAEITLRRLDVHWPKSTGARAAVPALIEALEDEDLRVRETACSTLRMIGDRSSLKALIGALPNVNAELRPAVIHALGRIGDAEAVGPLIRTMTDNEHAVRIAARRAFFGSQ